MYDWQPSEFSANSSAPPAGLRHCKEHIATHEQLVKRLVPDGLGPLLRELPSLPTRRAILLGWAAPAPTLVEIREIPDEYRPHSPDPAFWDVWTGKQERAIDWPAIVRTGKESVPRALWSSGWR